MLLKEGLNGRRCEVLVVKEYNWDLNLDLKNKIIVNTLNRYLDYIPVLTTIILAPSL